MVTKEDYIPKTLILCSYNDYGIDSKDHIIKQAKNEREKGHKFINHLILRDKTQEIDNVKFNFLLDDIPIMVYSLINVFRSRVRDAVIVGNKDSEKIFTPLPIRHGFQGPGKNPMGEFFLQKGMVFQGPGKNSMKIFFFAPATFDGKIR